MRSVLVSIVALLACAASPAGGDPWPLWGTLLERHTVETADLAQTRVDYEALRAEPDWPRLLAAVAESDPAALREPAERLAYWINVYNVFAVDVVVQGRPAESIRDLGSFLRPVWKRPAGTIGGRVYTLDEIEHGILRPLGDPRIHGAIVCASLSCPPLARAPYRVETLDAQLEGNLRRWLAHPDKGARFDGASGTLHLSSIFDWFEDDFDDQGGVLAFVRRYARFGRDPDRIAYLDYDWRLNRVAP